ncbi:MAG: CoA transferase, partial [Novosphingobium sp.]|nr:CoA transferase [Novosphingobium sp.]
MTDQASSTGAAAPLAGLRILEVAPPSAGAVTRFLAELGADVIQVPRDEAAADPVSALVANTGKRTIRLDLAVHSDRQRALELAADADILIDTRLDGTMPEWPGDDELAHLRRRNPRLVHLALSPFGKGNQWERWQATSSVIDALSGVLSRSGFPEKGPLPPPAEIALQCGYLQASWVALLAWFNRLRTGKGDSIDLSLVEAAEQAMDPGFGMAGSATAGVPSSQLPRGRPEARHQYPFLPCKDGFVRICVLAPRQWQGLFEWMGSPEKYAGPEFMKLHVRFASPTLLPDIAALFAEKTRAQLEEELGAHGVPMAPVLTLAEAIDTEQARARRALTEVTDAEGRKVRVPNGLVEVDGVRAGVTSVAREAAPDATWLDSSRIEPAPEADPPERPFSGLTILDLGVIVAGAEQSRLFADQGALTLKLENRAFPDGGRTSLTGEIVSINFAMGHRNKKGLGLNLRDPRGKGLFLDLTRQADLVLSNFKPGTLESLG